jgi:hypothetical protein
MPETIDYEALARQHGAIQSQPAAASGPDYAAIAKQFGATESRPPKIVDVPNLGHVEFPGSMTDDQISEAIRKHQSAEPGNHGFLEGAQHAVGEWWNQVNPIKAVQGMADVAAHPIDAIKAYGAANSHLADKAKESFQKGDYAEGLRHSLGYLLNGLPGVGSTIDEAGDKAHAGDLPGALGETAGFATMALAPELAAKGAHQSCNLKSHPAPGRANVSERAQAIGRQGRRRRPRSGADGSYPWDSGQ